MDTTPAPIAPVIDYAHGDIADKTYPVTAARTYGRETVLGEPDRWGNMVTKIVFYTGFAGCPARYYITTESTARSTGTSTTIQNATGLYPQD
jgi:hypothetical protein